MDREYVKKYHYVERKHWWFKGREKIILQSLNRHIDKNAELRILNIGAATGRNSEILQELGQVTSVEYDKEICRLVKEEYGLEYINATITELPFGDDSFDLVCAFDVVEHVEDDVKAVEEMKRVCSDKGIIAATVPAYQFLWSRHDVINHHHRRYTHKTFNPLFKDKEGFVYTTYFNTVLFPLIAFYRMLFSNVKQSKPYESGKSDFEVLNADSISNPILKAVLDVECFFLKFLTFPFGVSYLSIYKNRKPGV